MWEISNSKICTAWLSEMKKAAYIFPTADILCSLKSKQIILLRLKLLPVIKLDTLLKLLTNKFE
jgi:hypothetical protein